MNIKKNLCKFPQAIHQKQIVNSEAVIQTHNTTQHYTNIN